MKRSEFIAEITALVADLIPIIGDEYRASDDDEQPSMLLTIGADADGWSYQTGDNSYTGGAYGYHTWGIGYLDRESDPAEIAESIARDLEDNESLQDVPIFSEEQST